MKTIVEKLNYDGKGITRNKGVVTFISKVLPDEEIEYKILKEDKRYNIGKCLKIISKSPRRIESLCPYFNDCGGCIFQNVSYNDSLMYKKDIFMDLLKRNNIAIKDLDIIGSSKPLGYRNKITLKVENGSFGYYEEESHTLVNINKCLLAKDNINTLLEDLKEFNVLNGNITIRSNYNDELLIIIESITEPIPKEEVIHKHKIIGIIWNDKCLYGAPFFLERTDNLIYKVHYNAFFQVNNDISYKIGEYIKPYFNKDDIVYDLYCGVGYFSLKLARLVNKVYGIEINPKAIIDAKYNADLNNLNNLSFHVGKVEDVIDKINGHANKVIVDPPRAGLNKNVIKTFLQEDYDTIIYISCNKLTLVRDLKLLKEKYIIDSIRLFDMFCYTSSVECVCVLRKSTENKKEK